MKLIIKNDYDAMCDWAAKHIAKAINRHKEDRPFVLGLPTGYRDEQSRKGKFQECGYF